MVAPSSTGCATKVPTVVSTSPTVGSVSQGPAEVTAPDIAPCPAAPDARRSVVGVIDASDGTTWSTPADLAPPDARKLDDLYNDCTGVRPNGIADVDLDDVPILEIDPGGEVVTGYLFGDNYFELSVNGRLVGVDPVPYTPFNAAVVRFRVNRPVTYAVKLVDWEENPGLGTERLGADPFHAGDGGFIASFSDGTVTDASWQAQTFSIAPLQQPDDVVEREDGSRGTAPLGDTAKPGACAERCYATRYPIRPDWADPSVDPGWPAATTYTEAQVGTNFPAYQNFRPELAAGGAQFIWSSDLVLDNLVLARVTTE